MDYFCKVASSCDGLAFRALHDGSISAGVAQEIECVVEKDGFIIELPDLININDRFLSLNQLPKD